MNPDPIYIGYRERPTHSRCFRNASSKGAFAGGRVGIRASSKISVLFDRRVKVRRDVSLTTDQLGVPDSPGVYGRISRPVTTS